MINFILCDDNKQFLGNEKKLIDRFMMNYDLDYKVHMFYEYDNSFKKIITQDIGFKVYFLDIQTPKGSGLDMSRIIREEYHDWVSIIAIITAYNEFKYDALANRLYLLDFISKLNDCEKKINEALRIVMHHYDNRYKCLCYEYNHIVKRIEFRHIIYIEKELDSKRCIVKTTYGDFKINKVLNDTAKLLDKRFFKTSRSMIINVDYIDEYDLVENKITFKDGSVTYEISREKKKELKQYVTNTY